MTKIHNNPISTAAARLWRAALLPVLVALLLPAGLSSCIDEIEMGDAYIPDGETTALMNVSFSPLVTQELNGAESRATDMGGTVAPAGDRMDQIHSLYLLFYTNSGDLVRSEEVDLNKYKPELEERDLSDAVDVNEPTGATTGHKTYTYCVKNIPVTLQNGLYRIFAVANISDFLNVYSEEIQTIADLRDIQLNWVTNSIDQNSEMFGYFTNGKTDTRALNFEQEAVVTIKPDRNELHAWVRRAVSKLTIDFDGSGLRDNVSVYIKEARVYDIASGAYLGHYSCVGDVPGRNDATPVKGGFQLTQSVHHLNYGAGNEPNSWPEVTKKQSLTTYTDSNGKQQSLHSDIAWCLPFYENMQGGDGSVLKYQDADGDGNVDYPNAGEYEIVDNNRVWKHDEAKDQKPNGTYVEVIGYYESTNGNYTSRGDIKYRFMLGKNVRDNFDCERNHHYKLTLAFKGNGNDADWHIEYDEMQPIELPNPIYISYLYNKSLTFPITINTGGREIESLKIDITKSNWAPYFSEGWDPDDIDYYHDADIASGYGARTELGFLSLIKTSTTTIASEGDTNLDKIKNYFDREYTDDNGMKIKRGSRTYRTDVLNGEKKTFGQAANGQYTVEREGNVLTLNIPLYTRAKQLIKESAYTGNNPFTGYPREAEITVSVKYKGIDEPVVQKTPVFQVRRLVNPKGIYRDADNNTAFHVKLMELQKETATSFDPLLSVGPWKAYVLCGDDLINLDGKKEVSGESLSEVDFMVNFTGTTNANESRFAIIEILYHSYSCVHQIFVRQGDAPVQMFSQKVNNKSILWHTKNMRIKTEETANPLDEGSLFRFGKWDYPIDASNNKNEKDPWIAIKPTDFKGPYGPFKMANDMSGPKVAWSTISSVAPGTFEDVKDSKGNVLFSIPTVGEFTTLRDNTEQAYGVLYGNDATEVQSELNKVYGYQRDEDGKADGSYGIRGCFAYINNSASAYNGRHVFFPIGASGYGHRKQHGLRGGWGGNETLDGTLRYAAGRVEPYRVESNHLTLPLFYDLYKRPGALYWAREKESALKIGTGGTTGNPAEWEKDGLGLDVNYFTFDFNYISCGSMHGGSVVDGNSDACFIRCVTRK